MEPILTYSDITGSVYIATKYRRIGRVILDAQEKFDVTDWVERYAKKRNAQTVEENAKLRELVLKNWYIMLSEREALRKHKCDEAYISSLDEEIGKAKAKMRELGMEIES